ncbi:MAG: RsmB/NOP family class I SAM-dependent RNA methyltransferase [Deltaproteobacteria bacterium]|nr:RsmB/NOP family class I SAM-dependent RNA methyltransferase [Deltaproteobacteria bacterium]
MTNHKRYSHQIENLVEVSDYIHQQFQAQRPVDQTLTRFFRQNKKYGSSDRRLISNAVFGYYRWYGWLKWLEPARKELALLLGYLLDANQITDLVEFWRRNHAVREDCDLRLLEEKGIDTKKKLEIIRQLIPEAEQNQLFPPQARELPPQTLDILQSRASLWVRLEEGVKESFLAFLKQNETQYRLYDSFPEAIEIHSALNINLVPDYRDHKVEVQDISSQLVGKITAPSPGEFWVDLCAGSGGKTLHLMSLMKNQGTIKALEIRESIFKNLLKRTRKKPSVIEPELWDGAKLPKWDSHPHGVLVDAPCSCSGTWRRSPDLRWHLSDEKIMAFQKTQLELLEKASSLLGKGGRLVYATCSFFRQENQDVIQAFLDKQPEFTLEPIIHPLSRQSLKEGLLILPPEINGNAMFTASMIRK